MHKYHPACRLLGNNISRQTHSTQLQTKFLDSISYVDLKIVFSRSIAAVLQIDLDNWCEDVGNNCLVWDECNFQMFNMVGNSSVISISHWSMFPCLSLRIVKSPCLDLWPTSYWSMAKCKDIQDYLISHERKMIVFGLEMSKLEKLQVMLSVQISLQTHRDVWQSRNKSVQGRIL